MGFIFLLGLIGFIASACSQASPTEDITVTGTSTGTLRTLPTDTPSATPLPTGYSIPTLSPTVTPTATQVYYEVQLDDDMYSIGYQFGVSPQAIMTANPSVDPRAMSVGTSLLIPVTPQPEPTATVTTAATAAGTAEATTTPDPDDFGEPDCYSDSLGGLWCFVLVDSNKIGTLENVSAVFTLSSDAQTLTETATLPLNLLPDGESLPLTAYFQPPIPEEFVVSAQIEFWLPVMADDQRYLTVEIVDTEVLFSDSCLSVSISGLIHIPEDGLDASYVWVSGTAFDADDHILAVRRWDSMNAASAGQDLSFEFFVYSLGGAIDHVDLVVEARAVVEPVEDE